MNWAARWAKGGYNGIRAERYLRHEMRRVGLSPQPVTDKIISDILDEYIYRLQALPNWGPGRSNFSALILGDRSDSRFDARDEMEQAARRIKWRLKGGKEQTWYKTARVVDIVLERHGLLTPHPS